MKVHEIMTAHARCVSPDNNLVEAAGLMVELDVGALPVCGEDDRLAGIVTDRDLAVRAVAKGRDPNTTLVQEVMTPSIVYIFADQAVEDATRVMQEHEIRRLPVLNRQKRLVGIVSLGDVAMSSNPAFSGTTLRQVSRPNQTDGRSRKRDAMGRAAGASEAIWPGDNSATRKVGERKQEKVAGTSRRSTAAAARTPHKRKAAASRTRSASTRKGASAPRRKKAASARSGK
ncbi:MAG: CBS domain-containing protein [Verrucomicrobiota bacterium]